MNYLQQQEHADHVFGAQYDDVRERYASELEDLRQDDLSYQYEQEQFEIDNARLKQLHEYIAHSNELDLSISEVEKLKYELAQIEDRWDDFNESLIK